MRISDWSSDVCSSDLLEPIYADINTRLVDAGILPELQPALKPAERTRPLAAKPVPDGAPEARPEEPDSTRRDAETLPEIDRKSGVEGKSVSVRVDLGCRRSIQKKKIKDTLHKT